MKCSRKLFLRFALLAVIGGSAMARLRDSSNLKRDPPRQEKKSPYDCSADTTQRSQWSTTSDDLFALVISLKKDG